MMWIVVLTFLITGEARLDGRQLTVGTAPSQELCEAKIKDLIEKHGPPPGKSTLECKQVEAEQPKE
jgi:hypothetical protein